MAQVLYLPFPMNTTLTWPSILIVLALFSPAAPGAGDGPLDSDSSGSSLITLSLLETVQISNVKDIPLGTYAGSGDVQSNTTFCVYRAGGGDYSLTLSADTGDFAIDSGTTGDSIPFAAKVDDDLDPSDGQTVSYNTVTSTALSGSATIGCGGSDNASLEVYIAETDLQSASSASDYQATVTLFVEPL